jgi:formylglycine-generating enzyme required for sulfatase activity
MTVVGLSVPREMVNSIGMKFALIPAGKFVMGSPPPEQDAVWSLLNAPHRASWEPHIRGEQQHEVTMTRAFYLGVHQVTQVQWRAVMGGNPSWFCATGGGKDNVQGMNMDDFPVECVSWEDAQDFLTKLSALKEERAAGRRYRLPTEAEWEYACRGGLSSQTFHFGDSLSSTQANFDGNYPYGGAARGPFLERTCQVGSYPENGYGLKDMHGNVWEWCADWYDPGYYATSPVEDPAGPAEGSSRFYRGGSWRNFGWYARSAFRRRCPPGYRARLLGLRAALAPASPEAPHL